MLELFCVSFSFGLSDSALALGVRTRTWGADCCVEGAISVWGVGMRLGSRDCHAAGRTRKDAPHPAGVQDVTE